MTPVGMEQARLALPEVAFCDGPYECVEGADALVFVNRMGALDLDRIKQVIAASPVIVDLRNIYRPDEMARLPTSRRRHRVPNMLARITSPR